MSKLLFNGRSELGLDIVDDQVLGPLEEGVLGAVRHQVGQVVEHGLPFADRELA